MRIGNLGRFLATVTFAIGAQLLCANAQALVAISGTDIAGGTIIFNNTNGGSVNDSTISTAPTFTLAVDTYIAEIDTYRKGNPALTGSLGLKNITTNQSYLFAASAIPPHLYDIYTYFDYVNPNTVFAAGTYEIVDTLAASSWASNSGSQYIGFAVVYSAPAPVSVPEPAGLALVGLGLAGLALARRKKRRDA